MTEQIVANRVKSRDIGLCLDCLRRPATNVVMLRFRAPIPGSGWGCVQCHKPLDGAISVLCDACRLADRPITRICLGRPSEAQHTMIDAINLEPFDHDYSQHPEVGGKKRR